MSTDGLDIRQPTADKPPTFWRKQGSLNRAPSSIPETKISEGRIQLNTERIAKHSSWRQDSLQSIAQQPSGEIDPARIKLASLALAGSAANDAAAPGRIKAAWPDIADIIQPGLAELPAASGLPSRAAPRPYRTFSNASDLSGGRQSVNASHEVKFMRSAVAPSANGPHSPAKLLAVPLPRQNSQICQSIPGRVQKIASGVRGSSAEPSLISWEEAEVQEDVYQAITLADGRPALIKGRSGAPGQGELLVLMGGPASMSPAYPQHQLSHQQQLYQQQMLSNTVSMPSQHQMGAPPPGLWSQPSIPVQQPDSPIINTHGNPFAPPRAYLLQEEEEEAGQRTPAAPDTPSASNPRTASQQGQVCCYILPLLW
ncbi:hypothetical protein WJX84_007795 [Apatococcus fuscideae]|uniref:Uncharacterized protein n=1 Tax=Apatococcus fuscideae TaxID=2026836 RepID=A0AAW1SN68_9CHLO